MKRTKVCGVCLKQKVIWKARTRDHPQMCKECFNAQPKDKTIIEQVDSIMGESHFKNAKTIISVYRPSKHKPIAKISHKQLERLKLYKIVKDEHFKEYPHCQYPNCTNTDRQLHHERGRVGNLLFDKRYFKTLCDEHHKFVENNPSIAKQMKLSANRLDKQDGKMSQM